MSPTPVELIDVSDSGEEPVGIIAEGHVDIDWFRNACIARQREQHGLDPDDIDPCTDVQHLHYVATPSSRHEGGQSFVEVDADWWGARPVTVATFENGSHWTTAKEAQREIDDEQRLRDERSRHGDRVVQLREALQLLEYAAPGIAVGSIWRARHDGLTTKVGEL